MALHVPAMALGTDMQVGIAALGALLGPSQMCSLATEWQEGT